MKNLIYIFIFTFFVHCTLYIENCMCQYNPVGIKLLDDAIVGDNPHTFHQGPPAPYTDIKYPNTISNRGTIITINEVSPNFARTYYDLQSNACLKYIWQEQNNPGKIHAIFMIDQVGSSPNFPDRRTRYFVSNDTGNTWNYIAEVPNGVRSGYPCLITLSDNRQAILNHTVDGGIYTRSQIYLNSFSGSGVFSRLDPGVTSTSSPAIWPVGIPTSNILLNNKIIFIASESTPSDQSYSNICTGFSGNGIFLGYTIQNNINSAQTYALAKGPNNKIGIAYVSNTTTNPNLTSGSVYFMESTNSGTSWGSPVTIWNANYNFNGDSLGCLRSIDLVYQGDYPKVIFNLCKQTGLGNYFPDRLSKLAFWSPNINNGNPLQIEEAPGLTGTNPTNDAFVSLTRGVIGTSSDGTILYAAYNKARTEADNSGNNYFDVYFTYSTDGGLYWSSKTKVTNNTGALRDCRYVAISPTNNFTSSTNHYVHLIYQQDSIPASYVNGSAPSLARMMYAKIKITDLLTGINRIDIPLPIDYKLEQNYPNPFNPTTNIKFQIVKSGNVKLTVFDMLGKEIATLVNEKLSPGTYETTFDASQLTSGIYFYRLQTDSYTETKRMTLVK